MNARNKELKPASPLVKRSLSETLIRLIPIEKLRRYFRARIRATRMAKFHKNEDKKEEMGRSASGGEANLKEYDKDTKENK